MAARKSAKPGPNLRVELQEEGGVAYFPGLAAPFELSADTLRDLDIGELERLVHEALAHEVPKSKSAKSRGADLKTYTLTIHEDGETRTLTYTETSITAEARALVQFINKRRTSKATGKSAK
jgi:hypothetical protein